MKTTPLLREDYEPGSKPYEIRKPDIASGDTYYFTTDSNLVYQVRFGKKKDNYLGNIINFSVISDEFEDEYSETNRGEVYRIIATLIEIIRLYHEQHPFSDSYEFSGEFKDNNDEGTTSIRTKLYYRYALRILNNNWVAELMNNKVVIHRN